MRGSSESDNLGLVGEGKRCSCISYEWPSYTANNVVRRPSPTLILVLIAEFVHEKRFKITIKKGGN